ncbi:MAG: PAS domain-containing protein [Saprospiraceae bacterium]|nr:PAS domain-containing protein [Saprospiraceae bacterium]
MEKHKKVYPTFESSINAPIDLKALDLVYDFRELMEALPAAIYLCNPDGKITFYNEAAVTLWGRKPQLGKDLWCGSWKIFFCRWVTPGPG